MYFVEHWSRMEQPNKPYGFPAREILIPALKVGALTGKFVLLVYGTSRNLSYLHIFDIQDENRWSKDYIFAIRHVFVLLRMYQRTTRALTFAQILFLATLEKPNHFARISITSDGKLQSHLIILVSAKILSCYHST